jgi:6-phosphogluconolactonase
MHIQVYSDVQAISQATADRIVQAIRETLETKSICTIALSGGSTPNMLHRLLAAEPYSTQIDWSRLHLFWGDERVVPFTDERNNARMAFETLLNHVPVPPDQIHVMRTDIPASDSAIAYEQILRQYFPEGAPSFDILLLGMGDDGHTLSLFPGLSVVQEQKNWVSSFWLEAQKMERITITAPLALMASRVFFLTAGKNKADAFRQVIQGEWNPNVYPAQLFRKAQGEVYWFIDQDLHRSAAL